MYREECVQKTKCSALQVAWGCYRYIEEIFTELAECRPFELLRTARDRGLYLMSKQARIIAMTCTHAALKRHEFLEYGLKCESLGCVTLCDKYLSGIVSADMTIW
jgi:hypothetical protein